VPSGAGQAPILLFAMSIVILAVDRLALRIACEQGVRMAGHIAVNVDESLVASSMLTELAWDALVVDDSELGHTAWAVAHELRACAPVVGLGLTDGNLTAAIDLPLSADRLAEVLHEVLRTNAQGAEITFLHLDIARRVAVYDGREVELTRTELRLLQKLLSSHPSDVSIPEILQSVWGFTEGRGTAELVRAHIRNLRLKLLEIGLPDAIRSRRGVGYALSQR